MKNLFLEKYKDYFKGKKYNITTFGCQMNEHDSERISYILENLGYTKTDDRKDADFILFNTCLVRENAELKLVGQVSREDGLNYYIDFHIRYLCN